LTFVILHIHRNTIKMYGIKSELHAKYKVYLFRQEFILFMKFMPCNMCVYMYAV